MSGIGMVMNTAKGAIAAQQYGLNVTGHNIANVNTPHFSRQSLVMENERPLEFGQGLVGRGVGVDEIRRSSDQLLENRLVQQKSTLAAFEESEAYMNIMESFFNENSESSLSHVITEFWNAWHDLSNNPPGSAERVAVYEQGVLVAERFDALNADLTEMAADLSREIETAITEVNSIIGQIAQINKELVSQEVHGDANDSRDKRQALVTQLAQLMDINTYELSNGALTVTTVNGYMLAYGVDTYPLELTAGRITWQSSNGGKVDITDQIQGGKIGGWLDMRDEVVAKYKAEVDVLAQELIWSVNQQHSQGVGLEYFATDLIGTHATGSGGLLAALPFGHRIDFTKDFKMWVKDPGGTATEIAFNLGSLTPTNPPPNVSLSGKANSVMDTYVFTVAPPGGTVGPDTIDIQWSNSVISGTVTLDPSATPIDVEVDGMQIQFALGNTFPDGAFAISTDAEGIPQNPDSRTLADFVSAFNAANQAQFPVPPNPAGAGVTAVITPENTVAFRPGTGYSFAFGDDGTSGLTDSGMLAALGLNTFFKGSDAETIAVNEVLQQHANIAAAMIDPLTGEIAVGDNRNAMAMTDQQHVLHDAAQWHFERGGAATSTVLTATKEGYHQRMIGSMGLAALTIQRGADFTKTMVDNMQEQRDSISAVSLDEEMVNMMRYQHAFSVASKLLSVADEMLQTLIAVK